jgi:hypothetical protein
MVDVVISSSGSGDRDSGGGGGGGGGGGYNRNGGNRHNSDGSGRNSIDREVEWIRGMDCDETMSAAVELGMGVTVEDI